MEASGQRHIAYSGRATTLKVWFLGDLHIGNRGVVKAQLKRDIAAIEKDPNAFWFGVGDYAEFINPKDKRWDACAVDPSFSIADLDMLGEALYGRVAEMLWPIRDKCLGLAMGNHEFRYLKNTDQGHLHRDFCAHMGAPNLGYCAFCDVVFSRTLRSNQHPRLLPPGEVAAHKAWSVRFFIHHGAGAAGTAGGKLNRLKHFVDAFDADVYAIGHLHDELSKRFQRIGANHDCTELIHKDVIALMTGSYLATYAKGVTTYGEIKGYSPSVLGAVHVRIQPSEGYRKITAET